MHMKTFYINRHIRIYSELFEQVRRYRGLSMSCIALDVNVSHETVRRALMVGADSRASTVSKLGRRLQIPLKYWYVKRNSFPETSVDEIMTEIEDADKAAGQEQDW